MIDIQLLRRDIDSVAKRLEQRGYTLDVAGFNSLEAERKELQLKTESMQASRNTLSKQIGQAKAKARMRSHSWIRLRVFLQSLTV